MQKKILTIILLLVFANLFGQTNSVYKILSEHYEFKMISSGENFPNFNTQNDTLTDIIVLLHNKIAVTEIQRHFNWTADYFENKIKILISSNFVKKDILGNLKPNVFVCSIDEGKKMKQQLKNLTLQTVKAINKQLPSVKDDTKKIQAFKNINFKDISLFLLSDVLLDNWQIENVENDFLKSKRTERHGKYYYVSYQQKQKINLGEALGIYGNQFEDTLNFSICRYGNQRYIKDVIKKNEKIKLDFSINSKEIKYPVIDTIDYKKLQNISDKFKPTLLKILNRNNLFLRSMYKKSIYSSEVSFQEYFIWLYHIYYTAVTDELIEQKLIELPKEKVAFYILIND